MAYYAPNYGGYGYGYGGYAGYGGYGEYGAMSIAGGPYYAGGFSGSPYSASYYSGYNGGYGYPYYGDYSSSSSCRYPSSPRTSAVGATDAARPYMAPAFGYQRSPVNSYTPSVPVATVGVDTSRDGRANMYVTGVDMNRDGVPDALQANGYAATYSKPALGAYNAPPSPAPVSTIGVDTNRDGRANMYVTGVDMNRDGVPDALQANAYATPYTTPVPATTYGTYNCAAPVAAIGDALQAKTYAAPYTTPPRATTSGAYTAPIGSSPMATVGVDTNRDGRANMYMTGVDMNRDGVPDALQARAYATPYTTPPPATTHGAYTAPGGPLWAMPTTTVGVDTSGDGKPNLYVTGVDTNRDGIPDVIQNGPTAPQYATNPAAVPSSLPNAPSGATSPPCYGTPPYPGMPPGAPYGYGGQPPMAWGSYGAFGPNGPQHAPNSPQYGSYYGDYGDYGKGYHLNEKKKGRRNKGCC